MEKETQYADRCVALAATSVARSGAIPVAAGQPLFPTLFPYLSKVGRVGQIAARFTLLAAYYGAATLPAYLGIRPPA